MGIKAIGTRKRFVVETPLERQRLENARDYFGSVVALMNVGLDYKTRKRGFPLFYDVKAVRVRKGKTSPTSISIQNSMRIGEYSKRYENGERYDEKTFVRPDFD